MCGHAWRTVPLKLNFELGVTIDKYCSICVYVYGTDNIREGKERITRGVVEALLKSQVREPDGGRVAYSSITSRVAHWNEYRV